MTELEIPWNEVPEEIRRVAIKARENFLKDDYLTPALIVSGGGQEHIIDVRPCIPDKMDALESLMIDFAKRGATLLVVVAEAYLAYYGSDPKRREEITKLSQERRLKDAPGRLEVIHVSGETPEAWYSLKARIQRERKLRVLEFECWRMTREEMTEAFEKRPARLQNIFHKASI